MDGGNEGQHGDGHVLQRSNAARAKEPRPRSPYGQRDDSEGSQHPESRHEGARLLQLEAGPGGDDGSDGKKDEQAPGYRRLSYTERAMLARSVGAVHDVEQAKPVHPRHWWWPPRGMAPGLYRNVVEERTMWFCFFHVTSTLRWVLMLLHIVVAATMAALGQGSPKQASRTTALAAANTVIAGILALMHNSGLPDRYRNNKAEFEIVEDHICRLVESGLVPVDQPIEQTVADCFDRLQDAKAAVRASLPAAYNSKRSLKQPFLGGHQLLGGNRQHPAAGRA
ncbi:hypothetical protein GMORB2_0405 [Geosmithia morbida]|uniref:SMODS and SLOG-associating 2TM effector domain-containing protein n=1 Tax=Geosmithia morbida TaxID=1094350 RepID=A0A9P4Z3C1_9HYPO|nr:uncharacterized protein GMORB2_0405 [Geosmithia morbida]KAF4126669.1 hypothetical protein GMORB2_0405 [Geosmithia morbida]